MSLTIALKVDEGIALAADSRVTEGFTLEGPRTKDNSVKFIRLNDAWGIQTYGNSEIGFSGITALERTVSEAAPEEFAQKRLREEAGRIFCDASREWSGRHPEIPRRDKDTGFVLSGYDRGGDGLTIINFQSPDFHPSIARQGILLGGQWLVAKYFVKRLFNGDIPLGKAKELAVLALRATMAVEKTVGGEIRLAVVTPADGFRWISETETLSLQAKTDRLEIEFLERFRATLTAVAAGDGEMTAKGEP